MLNGGALNSYSINSEPVRVVSAFADIGISFEISAIAHDTIFASANMIFEFELEGFCVRVPQAFSNISIAFVIQENIRTIHAGSAEPFFSLWLSPASVFAVFALATIEFRMEPLVNGVPAFSEIAIYVEIQSAKATKIVTASSIIDCSISIDQSLGHIVAGANAFTDIRFIGSFAPDLNFVRNTGADVVIFFDVIPTVAISPQLSAIGIEFSIATTSMVSKATYAYPVVGFIVEAFGTRVFLATADIEFGLEIITKPSRLIDADADIYFLFAMTPDSFHDAYAGTDCEIKLSLLSTAFYGRSSDAEIFVSFPVQASPMMMANCDLDARFIVGIDFIEEHIKLAKQIFADILLSFVSSAVPTQIARGIARIAFEFDVISDPRLAEHGYSEMDFEFGVILDPRLLVHGYSEMDFEFGVISYTRLAEHGYSEMDFEFDVISYTRLAEHGYSEMDFEFDVISDPRLAEHGYSEMDFEFDMSAISHKLIKAYCFIAFEFMLEKPEALLGIYEPADECRTIYVESDFNVIFVQYEDRELRIAC